MILTRTVVDCCSLIQLIVSSYQLIMRMKYLCELYERTAVWANSCVNEELYERTIARTNNFVLGYSTNVRLHAVER